MKKIVLLALIVLGISVLVFAEEKDKKQLERMGQNIEAIKNYAEHNAQIDERIKAIKEYESEGKKKEAVDLWNKSIADFPESVRIRNAYVMYLISNNEYDAAQKICLAAVKDFPEEKNLKVFQSALVALKAAKNPEDIKKAKDDLIIGLLDITNPHPEVKK